MLSGLSERRLEARVPIPGAEATEIPPVEILELIFALLDTPSLGRCMLVSRLTHHIAAPLLYHTLVVDLAMTTNPLSCRGTPLRSAARSDLAPKGGQVSGRTETEDGAAGGHSAEGREQAARKGRGGYGRPKAWRKLVARLFGRRPDPDPVVTSSRTLVYTDASPTATLPPNPPQLASTVSPLPDRFSFTRHLTITSHDHNLCQPHATLIMPHLHTLRIRPAPQQRFLSVCPQLSLHEERDSPLTRTLVCPVLTELRPRQLVIGGISTSLIGMGVGLWRGEQGLPPCVKDVVVFVGNKVGQAYVYGGSFLQYLPCTVDRLTLVDIAHPSHRGGPLLSHNFAERFSEVLGEACSGGAQALEVVGLESHPELLCEGWLASLLLEKGWSADDARAREASVVFTSKREYDQRQGAEVEPTGPAFVWERPNHLQPLSVGGGSGAKGPRWREIFARG